MKDSVALVMAAGQSRRFGSDKRKAVVGDGKSLLASTIQSIPNTYRRVFVAVRPDDNTFSLNLPDHVYVIRCLHALEGLSSSMAEAFAAIEDYCITCYESDVESASTSVESIAVILGDMPFIDESTHTLLHRSSGAQVIVRPIYNGQPGHPVIVGREYWGKVKELRGDDGAKAVLADANVTQISVDDPGVIRDIDRQKDIPSA